MKTKKYFSLSLIIATVLLSGFAGASLAAETKWLDEATINAAAPYFAPLLVLEDTPPAGSQSIEEYYAQLDQDKKNGTKLADRKSIAFPVSAGLMKGLVNAFAAYQDYFGLLSDKVKPFFDTTQKQDADGATFNYYSLRPDVSKDQILGYISCLDIQVADKLAASQAGPDTPYEIYNNLGVYQNWNTPDKEYSKLLTLNLGYNYLSAEAISALSGYYQDPTYNGTSLTIGNQAYSLDLKKSNIPQNCYSLTLSVAFDDTITDVSDRKNYGDVYDKYDPNNNYGDFTQGTSAPTEADNN